MNIVEINYADRVGHIFNGYDLHLALIGHGISAKHIVLDKRSHSESVKGLSQDQILHRQIEQLELKYAVSNMLFPYGEEIIRSDDFREADLVHYHILHNGMISLLDYPRLFNMKKSVWTIHDPWIITGNCLHPLDCEGWEYGCGSCRRLNDGYFNMREDNTAFMWKAKREVFKQINPDIVVASDFMKRYIQRSPLTEHFDRVHIIPFGVDICRYQVGKRSEYRRKFGIQERQFVIVFRAEDMEIKGCKYIYDALRAIGRDSEITLIIVGAGKIPEEIRNSYRILSFGWVDDEQTLMELLVAGDLFLMPSLAESFGLMAVEAMAAECAVMCFENTVVAEITEAPKHGIAVSYRSSDEIAREIVSLKNNRESAKIRGWRGRELVKDRYRFEEYVERHVRLYKEICGD